MPLRSLSISLVLVLSVAFIAHVSAARAAEQGPRMSDAELLQAVDLQFPGMEAVAKAVAAGNRQAALDALAAFFRHRKEPRDFCPKPKRVANAVLAAEKILKHQVAVVGIPYAFPGPVDWRFNPTTAPDTKLVRDHEWTWQFNRHREFVTLAEAYRATGDEKFAREFAEWLASWIRDRPVPDEAANVPFSAWRTIECGIRTSSTWPAALAAFRASPSLSDRLLLDWLKSWLEHGSYLHRFPRHGNWLTMEMNGLYHIGTLVPFAKEAESWRNYAAERLAKETEIQVYPDGAQFELAPGYHNVALRNMLAIPRLAEDYGRKVPDGYLAGLEKMFAYNLWAMQPDGSLPEWNDSGRGNVRGLLAEGAAIFPHRQDFLWVATQGKRGSPPDHTSHYFPWAGQVIMRSGWDRKALFLGFEAGPFGAGHQHEDKLSAVIFADRPLLVEGGIYPYDASKWRSYVLGSQAHNVVLVDGAEQNRRARRETFLAKAPLDADFQSNARFDFARGVYEDGFAGGIRVRHEREVLFDKPNQLFVIRDRLAALDGKGHRYEALWHLDTDKLHGEPQNGIYETQSATQSNLRMVVAKAAGLECRVVEGQVEPVVQGWLPRPLYEGPRGVRPIPCVICGQSGERAEFLTVFQPLKTGSGPRVAAAAFRDGSVEITWSDSRKTTTPWPK
ncbi:MAG: alginate lyase family protein [Pirellulales bacterium]|nr:alginate lyase family protein [Pirellulales bacterium]